MNFDELILKIVDRLELLGSRKKSLVEIDLGNLSEELEEAFFKIRIKPEDNNKLYPKLYKKNIPLDVAVALLFMSYLTQHLRDKISYGQLWSVVTEELHKYSSLSNTFFVDHYFIQNYPSKHLVNAMQNACRRYNLRNAFDHQEDQHFVRNTILLQMGLISRFSHLNLWLSGYHNQITVRVLLDREDENYSDSFAQGWRVIRRYRDHLIDERQATSLLRQNVWYKQLRIDDILRAARKKIGKKLVVEEEIESIFFVDKVLFANNLLTFVINAEDIYALHLQGSAYDIRVNGGYGAKLLLDEAKNLVLDKQINITEPESNVAEIEVVNEDGETVYHEEILLFDFKDQILLSDEKGNVFKNIFKKLSRNGSYNFLIDSDLDCDAPDENQFEYFDGFATLVTGASFNNNYTISYDGQELFSLNFSDEIEKPEWIDRLVVYAADTHLNVDEEVELHLKIFDQEDETEPLKDLPEDVTLLRWTYSGSYVENEDIENFSAKIVLTPEVLVDRRHSFFIRFGNRTFSRVVQAVFYSRSHEYHLIQTEKNLEPEFVSKDQVLEYDSLMHSKLHLVQFNYEDALEPKILKDKTRVYGSVRLNKNFQPKSLPCFGETVGVSEHIRNTFSQSLFKVKRQGIVKDYDLKSSSVTLKEVPPYFGECDFILLDDTYQLSHRYGSDMELKKNVFGLKMDALALCILFKGNYVGSFVQYHRIRFNDSQMNGQVLSFLHMSYLPVLLMNPKPIREWIASNPLTFLEAFFNDKFILGPIKVQMSFDEVSSMLEHLLYGVELLAEDAKHILETIVLKDWIYKVLEVPIFLVYLLMKVQKKQYIELFENSIPEYSIPEDIDESYVQTIVSNVFKSFELTGIAKHNLKIAMHYKYRHYYLALALESLKSIIRG